MLTIRLKALQQARPTNSTIIPRMKHETNCLSGWTFECCRFLGQDFHLVYRAIPIIQEWFFILYVFLSLVYKYLNYSINNISQTFLHKGLTLITKVENSLNTPKSYQNIIPL